MLDTAGGTRKDEAAESSRVLLGQVKCTPDVFPPVGHVPGSYPVELEKGGWMGAAGVPSPRC